MCTANICSGILDKHVFTLQIYTVELQWKYIETTKVIIQKSRGWEIFMEQELRFGLDIESIYRSLSNVELNLLFLFTWEGQKMPRVHLKMINICSVLLQVNMIGMHVVHILFYVPL